MYIQVVLCGAFYPNYFRWGVGDEEVNQKIFCGHNHCTTVMVSSVQSGLPLSPSLIILDAITCTPPLCLPLHPSIPPSVRSLALPLPPSLPHSSCSPLLLSLPPSVRSLALPLFLPRQLAGLPPNGPEYAGALCDMFRDCVAESGSSGPRGKALHFDGSK